MGHLLNGARSEAAASDRRLLQRQRRPRTANFVTAPDLVLQCNYDTLDLPCPNTAFDLLFEETAVTLGLVGGRCGTVAGGIGLHLAPETPNQGKRFRVASRQLAPTATELPVGLGAVPAVPQRAAS